MAKAGFAVPILSGKEDLADPAAGLDPGLASKRREQY